MNLVALKNQVRVIPSKTRVLHEYIKVELLSHLQDLTADLTPELNLKNVTEHIVTADLVIRIRIRIYLTSIRRE